MTMTTKLCACFPTALCFVWLFSGCLDAYPPLTPDAAVPRVVPDAGVSPDVGGTGGVSPSSACSGCQGQGPNAPAPIVAPLCQFNHQCGRSGRCFDGARQTACTSSASCGTGDVCRNGFCQADPNGGDACVFSAQCADGICINGTACANPTPSPNPTQAPSANAQLIVQAQACESTVCAVPSVLTIAVVVPVHQARSA